MSEMPKTEGQPVGAQNNVVTQKLDSEAGIREPWAKPEIVSFLPVSDAQGINCNPTDGTSNFTY